MSTQFLEASPLQGFDGTFPSSPWQYVPVNGSRLVAIHAAANLKLSNGCTSMVEAFEVYPKAPYGSSYEVRQLSDHAGAAQMRNAALKGARFFALRGKASGIARFMVGGHTLNLDVAYGSSVRVRMHLVSDSGGEFRSRRTKSEVSRMLVEANKIMEPQCGMSFVDGGVTSFTASRGSKSFGAEILHDRDNVDLPRSNDATQWITSRGERQALNFFFVWNIKSTAQNHNTATPDAVAIDDRYALLGNRIMYPAQGGAAMVHEFVHNCGRKDHDTGGDSIMQAYNAVTPDSHMRHGHVAHIRTWYNKPW